MSHFLFNGVSSLDLGLIVTQPVLRPSWEEDVREEAIPGEYCKLMIGSGIYNNAELTIQTAIPDADAATLDRIYGTLHGFGKLQLSTSPTEYLEAYVNKLEPKAVAALMGELPVSFSLRPFARAVEPAVVDMTHASGTSGWYYRLDNPGSAPAEPLISIVGSGTLHVNVNGEDLKIELPAALNGKTIYLDSEISVAYYEENGSKHSITQYTYGNFPLLKPGSNGMYHFGDVTSCIVNLRERWL